MRYLSTFDSTDASLQKSREHAIRAVVMAIRMPKRFYFEELLKLEAIRLLKNEPVFALLQIFDSHAYTEYLAFIGQSSNAAAISKLGFEQDELARKIRLITLAQLAAEHVRDELSYDAIVRALQITPVQVESWIIDAIENGLIEARIDQLHRQIFVT